VLAPPADQHLLRSRGKAGAADPGRARLAVRSVAPLGRIIEQAREVPEKVEEELSELPLEVDEADAAEQIRDAGYDDEDYR